MRKDQVRLNRSFSPPVEFSRGLPSIPWELMIDFFVRGLGCKGDHVDFIAVVSQDRNSVGETRPFDWKNTMTNEKKSRTLSGNRAAREVQPVRPVVDLALGSGPPDFARHPTPAGNPSLHVSEVLESFPPGNLHHVFHELRVDRIELEMQNGNPSLTQREPEVSREEYNYLYDLAPVGYLTLSELGMILKANSTIAHLLGATKGVLLNRLLTSFLLPEDVDSFFLHRKRLFEIGEPQVFETRMVRRDGTHLWTRMEAARVRGAEGSYFCRLAVSDISAGKQAEEALREGEKRLRMALDAARIGDWQVDPATGETRCSPRFGQIFGYGGSLPEWNFRVFLEHVHPEDRALVESSLLASMETERDWYREFRIVRPDRTVRWVWARGSTFRNGQGRQNKMFGMVADITEHKTAEAKLKRAEEKQREVERKSLTRKIRELDGKIESSLEMQLGRSSAMQKVISDIRTVASSDYSLIIEGETGTGKTLIASIIHTLSNRSQGPFIVLDMSVIPENLIESELFGYEKGAFTGADRKKKGYFEIANGGTVFFDELQSMTPYVQNKILKVVEERSFYPVGANQLVETDIRIIGATNGNIRQAVKDLKFREDLYYRLNEASLRLPPLRKRRADIIFFTQKYLFEVSSELHKPIGIIDDEVLAFLRKQYWPGNVRELKNVIRKAALFCAANTLTLEAITQAMSDTTIEAEPVEPHGPQGQQVPLSIPEAEKLAIGLALRHTGGNKTKAAGVLQITLKTLLAKIRKYSL